MPAASRRSPWAHRTDYARWTMERLEHLELVAARYSIRRAAPSSDFINYHSDLYRTLPHIHCALLQVLTCLLNGLFFIFHGFWVVNTLVFFTA